MSLSIYSDAIKNLTSQGREEVGKYNHPKDLSLPGLTCIGDGLYGAVFIAGPDAPTVLKLGFNPSDPWPYYAEWVRSKKRRSPAYPRIPMLMIGNGFYAAEIERLAIFESIRPLPAWKPSSLNYQLSSARLCGCPEYVLRAMKTVWTEAAEYVIKRLGLQHDWMLRRDMHRGNLMVRNPGPSQEYVITDPIAS